MNYMINISKIHTMGEFFIINLSYVVIIKSGNIGT